MATLGTQALPGRPSLGYSTDDLVTHSIPAGGYVRQFTWAGYTESGASGAPLPPGTYRIVGGPGASSRTHGSVSEPVNLELVPPEPE